MKRKELERSTVQKESQSQAREASLVEELKQKIEGYVEKEKLLRENIEIMES